MRIPRRQAVADRQPLSGVAGTSFDPDLCAIGPRDQREELSMCPTQPLVRGVDGIDELGVRRGIGDEHVFTVPTSFIPAVTHVTKQTNFSGSSSRPVGST